MHPGTLFAPCYICGESEQVRPCCSCMQNVCITHRVAQQPPEEMPQFICSHCWEYLVNRVGAENLYPPVPDPDWKSI